MKILLAGDEVFMARAVVKILEKGNYYADAVYNGIDAINYLVNGDYDAGNGRNRSVKGNTRAWYEHSGTDVDGTITDRGQSPGLG